MHDLQTRSGAPHPFFFLVLLSNHVFSLYVDTIASFTFCPTLYKIFFNGKRAEFCGALCLGFGVAGPDELLFNFSLP